MVIGSCMAETSAFTNTALSTLGLSATHYITEYENCEASKSSSVQKALSNVFDFFAKIRQHVCEQ